MIFQISIPLEIEGRNVHAVMDSDTGLIGFTEMIEGEEKDFFYLDSPTEFKVALADKLIPLAGKKQVNNFKICRKHEKTRQTVFHLKDGK